MQQGDTEEADSSGKPDIHIYRTNSKEKNKWENLGEL